MLHLGTFFSVIAVALAATISIDDQTQPFTPEELTRLNSTSTNPDRPELDKGLWDVLVSIIPGFNKPSSSSTSGSDSTSSENYGPVEFPKLCAKCKCGLTNTQNRIVGGVETKKNQYPWMAMLLNQGRFYCGASAITDRHVLTAAHCVDGFDVEKITVRLLVHDKNSNSGQQPLDFKVKRKIKHNGYSNTNYDNDIALIELLEKINFDGSVRPVCLPPFTKTFTGEKAIVTGWGATGESGPISNTLQEVTVPILSNIECKASKYPAHRITDNMICAGYKEGGKDSCQGDSGGPLHIVNNSTHSVAGIVSWGEGCAAANYPGVYTRVNRFITWIHHNTRNGCYC